MEGEVGNKKLEWEPVITPAIDHNLDSRPMEGITYLEHPAPAVYLATVGLWKGRLETRN